jgi:hypothetical protein
VAPPSITTAPASIISRTSAQLNGDLNPNGSATTYYFQWGTSTAYGNTSTTGKTNNGVSALHVNVNITGLAPATTYHYRLVGASANGTTYGADQAFTSASSAPTPAPLAGRYRGQTKQRWPITLRIASNRRQLTALTFSFGLRCTNRQHRHLSYSISTLGSGRSWRLNAGNGLGFDHRFIDSGGTRYRVTGRFSTTGTVTGTLNATWKTDQYGTCGTGAVAWSAKFSR